MLPETDDWGSQSAEASGVAVIGSGGIVLADREMLLAVAVIGIGAGSSGPGVATIAAAAVISGARRLAESVIKAPQESEGQHSQQTIS